MKRSLKGALLSALVFPGAGQLWLKRYLRGTAFALSVSASLAVIILKAVHQALAILERAETEGGALDMAAITDAATRAAAGSGPGSNLALIALVVLWVAAVVDAYLVGRRLDLAEQAQRPAAAERPAGRDEEVP